MKSTVDAETPPVIKVSQSSALSPHNQAIYETGKKILADSIETGREFCKSMITISTGAIPIYLSMLGLVSSSIKGMGIINLLLISAPSFLYLFASLIFMKGYQPVESSFSLDIVEEIQAEINRMTIKRNRLIKLGVFIFSLATILAISVILFIVTG